MAESKQDSAEIVEGILHFGFVRRQSRSERAFKRTVVFQSTPDDPKQHTEIPARVESMIKAAQPAEIGLRIEGNTIEGVRDSPPGEPAAGIDVEPDDRGQPTLGVHIAHNVIEDNAGPGILLPLDTNNGPAMLASDLEITANTILRNARKRTPPTRAGVAIEGGQDGGQGTLVLQDNVIHDNGGPGILMRLVKLVVQQSGNDLSGNEGG